MIEVKGVGYVYPGGHSVLHDLSLRVEKGTMLGVLGENGSGKTTLARLVCGLLTPTSGSVVVDGLNTAGEQNAFQVRRKVGLVFQDPEQQIVETTVEREIGFGPRNLGLEPAEVRDRVDEAVGRFGIGHIRERPCHLLSAGEKQLVEVGAVFAMEPDYVVLDEPTALLDPAGRKTLLDALDSLLEETGAGVVFISMRLQDVWLCDRTVFLSGGRVVFEGRREGLLAHLRERAIPLNGLGLLAAQAQRRMAGRGGFSEMCLDLSPAGVVKALERRRGLGS